jgi:hypothetical protein
MKHSLLRTLATAALAIGGLGLLAACGDDDAGAAPGYGTLVVQLTDAPFPYDQVASVDLWVVRIDARVETPTDADAEDDADGSENGDDPSSEWVTIATPDRSINLLALQNGTVTNLGAARVPTGTYNGFRLILDTDRSSITLKDGMVLDGDSDPGVKWPSAGQTGIKVNLLAPISVVGDSTVMVLDFDIGKSFVQRGNTIEQNGLLFKPVIRGTARDITGIISGTVRAGTITGNLVPGASVEILRAGTAIDDTVSANVIATTSTDANGAFRAAWLLPGTYSIRATPPAALTTFNRVLQTGVVVEDGEETENVLVVLPAK